MSHSQFHDVKVPGDNNCFYHVVMLEFIHGILSGDLTENTSTGRMIKHHLLREIAAQFNKKGIEFNYQNKNLKAAILELMRLVPQQQSVISPAPDVNEITAIKNCALYYLLRDICAPALRECAHLGANQYAGAYKDAVKKRLFEEFCARLIAQSGLKFGFNENDIKAANNYVRFGEFPKNECGQILAQWNEIFAEKSAAKLEEKELKALFDGWWNEQQNTAIATYKLYHHQQGVMPSSPQRRSVAQLLQCQLWLQSKTSERPECLATENDAHKINYRYDNNDEQHFNAAIKNDDLGEAIQSEMQKIYDNKADLIDTEYQWQATFVEDSKETNEVIVTVKIEAVKAAAESVAKLVKANPQDDSLPQHKKDILIAANEGYANAFSNFFNRANVHDNNLTAEEENFLEAVKLQNEEIIGFLSRR